MTKEQAREIIDMHEIDRLLEDEEEVECLEMNNPSILEAYRALIAFAGE